MLHNFPLFGSQHGADNFRVDRVLGVMVLQQEELSVHLLLLAGFLFGLLFDPEDRAIW
jgi:hypothetical protein